MANETIINKSYDLLKFSIPVLNKLPRSFKFTFGDRVQQLLTTVLELLIEAFYQPQEHKRATLLRVNITLEKLRHYLRLGFELGLYASPKYRDFAQRVDEIGRMTGGWLKSLQE